jgi:hypothetical protein
MRGVITIASARIAPTPGAMRIGENMRASSAMVSTLLMMTRSGFSALPWKL